MLDEEVTPPTEATTAEETPVRRTRRRAAQRPAGPAEGGESTDPLSDQQNLASQLTPAKSPVKKATAKRSAPKKKAAAAPPSDSPAAAPTSSPFAGDELPLQATNAGTPPGDGSGEPAQVVAQAADAATDVVGEVPRLERSRSTRARTTKKAAAAAPPVALLFQAPDPSAVPAAGPDSKAAPPDPEPESVRDDAGSNDATPEQDGSPSRVDGQPDEAAPTRRRRSRGGRNRRKSSDGDTASTDDSADSTDTAAASGDRDAEAKAPGNESNRSADTSDAADDQRDGASSDDVDSAKTEDGTDDQVGSSHRRRRRRRSGEEATSEADGAVVKVRAPRAKKDSITNVEGSTRMEAKKQRRREGREAGRRRPPILSESEFLARRESVERIMAVRQRGETTQIAVLEDNVLVEHYVAIESQASLIGNVYLGRVQNVLPSMEAAFIDIGKGRNAVLYAGEVNWDLQGNQPRRIENALKPGQTVLVQVSKDPIGHKGARLTSQISLAGRYLVYVPSGGQSGISRKLSDIERSRLKSLLKDIIPEEAGVIIRTAAEGASEEELTRDVTRLTAMWEDIDKKAKSGQAPALLYGEPDTTIKVVRDLFTEDFAKLVISGDDAWDMVNSYVQHVAPDLTDRLERYQGDVGATETESPNASNGRAKSNGDLFADFRIDEQIAKALERKVWLPSGGSLVIDRTEAMTVVDVNTGKFTGSGGNLEQTVTKNNLEAAEEMVRQLRLRDIGGIIVIDFIDMVLEDNRDLVLRRLVECLGRDRTRHQVAEVTSLGLVQMTRKRISTGLLESFSSNCEACNGRGVVIQKDPVESPSADSNPRSYGGNSDNGFRGTSSKRSSNRRRGGKSSTDVEVAEKSVDSAGSSDKPVTAPSDAARVNVVDRTAGDPRIDSSSSPSEQSSAARGEGGDAGRTSVAPDIASEPSGRGKVMAGPAGSLFDNSGNGSRDTEAAKPVVTKPPPRVRRRASRPQGDPSLST